MVEIQVLPPRDDPERLTAKLTSHTLKEHLEGFLSANNANGFVYEEPVAEIKRIPISQILNSGGLSISELLLLFAQHEYVSETSFKNFTLMIRSRFKLSVTKCPKLGHIYEMMAVLFGYRTHSALKQYARLHLDEKHPGWIKNFRYGEHIQNAMYDIPANIPRWHKPEEAKKMLQIKRAFKEGRERKVRKEAANTAVVIVKKRRTIQKEV
jgi:hypothetical protein